MNQERFEELLLNQLSEISGRISSMDERISSVENRLSSLEQGMAWVRGKLEGRGEFWADIKSWIAIVGAVAAIIFAWLK